MIGEIAYNFRPDCRIFLTYNFSNDEDFNIKFDIIHSHKYTSSQIQNLKEILSTSIELIVKEIYFIKEIQDKLLELFIYVESRFNEIINLDRDDEVVYNVEENE